MAKRCPKCGASAGDEDVFCEADGTRLEREGGPSAAAGSPCPGCAASGTDDGDGYCSSCGHRLGGMSADVEDELELRALLVVGGDPRFPLVIDEPDRVCLAPADPRRLGPPLAADAKRLDAAGSLSILQAVVDIAATVERAGFAWAPRADDFHLTNDHPVTLSRLRGARPLVAGERLDVMLAFEALGQILLAEPGPHGPPPLVRALVTVPPPKHRARSVDEARVLLEEIERTFALPDEDAPSIAALTDVGVRHAHNEDAVVVASGNHAGEAWVVLVVCDGVSTSTSAEQASSIAAKSACDALAHFARSGDTSFETTVSAVSEAIRSAHVAVCASTTDIKAEDPPGTTIVCAFIHRKRLTVGWVGDSRAYWITRRGGELLTRDHSWVNETVDRGEMTEEEALRSPLAHALTKCLGPLEDANGQVKPSVRTRDLAGPGHLLLCSDGVWNYFSPDELVALVGSAPAPSTPPVIARFLVNRALARGGHDNASVAVYHHV